MVFLEQHARWLLIVHLVLAAATVAATTHLCVWLRHYHRGQFGRHKAVRKFAWISVALFGASLLVGFLIYPTYKVRVRQEYLENPTAVGDDYRGRAEARATVDRRITGDLAPSPPPRADPERTAKTARWFDVKEHVAAFGFAVALGLALIVSAWHPREHGDTISNAVVGLALVSAGTTWLSAIVGAVVTSVRAVG